MIALKLRLPEHTYTALQQAAIQTSKTESEVALDAIQTYLHHLSEQDPLLGLFADEPTLIDQVEKDAMQAREQTKLRLTEIDHE
jgi:hypothetical protein